jgi:GNAT superfamily N-acetyltransferase
MSEITLSVAANPFDYQALLRPAVKEYCRSPDACVDGVRISEREAVAMFVEGLVEVLDLVLIEKDGATAGIAIVSAKSGRWLVGHLFYVVPEYRGQGVMKAHIDPLLDLARKAGLDGFMFQSTSDKGGLDMDKELLTMQADGTPVFTYRRAA